MYLACSSAAEKLRVANIERGRTRTGVSGPLAEWVRTTLESRDIVLIGSHSVLEALRDADLVDEYRLIAFPTATGEGRRLFTDAADLTLVSSEVMGAGSLTVHTR